MRKLALKPVGVDHLSVATFAAAKPTTIKSPRVEVGLHLRYNTLLRITANAVPDVTGPLHRTAAPELSSLQQHLELADSLPPAGGENVVIDMLIGNDYYLDVVTNERLCIANSSVYLLSSKLGWILSGRSTGSHSSASTGQTCTMLTMNTVPSRCLNHAAQEDISILTASYPDQFWQLETLGITDDPQVSDDDEAARKFHSTGTYQDGRYQVGLPWKQLKPNLSSNFGLASGRLRSLVKRLSPAQLSEYDPVIQQQLAINVIEPVSHQSADNDSSVVHYMPHHRVEHPGKSTKLRIVYDASAKTSRSQLSLNEALYRGPVIATNLIGLLLRFRSHRIAIISDI